MSKNVHAYHLKDYNEQICNHEGVSKPSHII